MKEKVAAQLYTVRDEMNKDYRAVFKELKEMGWPAVQLSALPEGYEPRKVAASLKETGLATAGIHIDFHRLENGLEGVLEEVKLYDTIDIVCPFLPEEYRTAEGYRYVRETLNRVAKQAEGFRISYHNHDFELETNVDDRPALQYILEPVPENKVLAEVDVYWVKKGGQEPLSFIEPYRGRMPIIHLKDMTADDRQTFAEIGTGLIDFKPILEWGEKAGVEWYVVEQDTCPGNPMDSLRISLENLNRLIDQL